MLELENVGDTEAPYSIVMLDRFAVRYPHLSVAEGGKLEGLWDIVSGGWLRGEMWR